MRGPKTTAALALWSGEFWLILQGAAAATIAWIIANQLGEHSSPFFAPIAAIVALSFARGERGRSAVRLLIGVGIGISSGELMVFALGGGYLSFGLAVLIAAVAARLLGSNRLLRNQAAAAAILTVSIANGEAGLDRLLDAAIGAAVALVFTQILFSPEPVALVRRAEAATIASMSRSLRQAAEAIGLADDELARVAADWLEDMGSQLSELGQALRASRRTVRHSLFRRSRTWPDERVSQDAGRLDLLAFSCIRLIRTIIALEPADRARLLPWMRQLADILADLERDLGAVDVRQRAVDQGGQLIGELDRKEMPTQTAATAAVVGSLRAVARDIMVFAGPAPVQGNRTPFVSPLRFRRRLRRQIPRRRP